MATYAAYRHIELDNVGYGKKRVLKPPGGGSSDIFGGAPEDISPRRVKNHNQSQLGTALFGDGVPSTGSSSPDSPRAKPDGNPVTGTGYIESPPSQNGSSSASSINGDQRSTTDSSPANANSKPRGRVPPGGFSSGLW
uniref:Jupiter_2 protein n=1 Tax=Fopius arisanus TaxID=64838 RepID=A0A0C9RDI0_9HYME